MLHSFQPASQSKPPHHLALPHSPFLFPAEENFPAQQVVVGGPQCYAKLVLASTLQFMTSLVKSPIFIIVRARQSQLEANQRDSRPHPRQMRGAGSLALERWPASRSGASVLWVQYEMCSPWLGGGGERQALPMPVPIGFSGAALLYFWGSQSPACCEGSCSGGRAAYHGSQTQRALETP